MEIRELVIQLLEAEYANRAQNLTSSTCTVSIHGYQDANAMLVLPPLTCLLGGAEA